MNGIIVLCHFCEMHGPSALFCTQSFHSTHDPLDVLEGNAPSECASYYEGSYRSFTSPTSSECCSGIHPRFPAIKNPQTPPTSATCKTCSSLPDGTLGFITNDHSAHISFISSRYPNHSSLYSIVRQACVRSLSCEVCPGREGPVLFGDDKSGYVFSYAFKIKDGQARGFQRWYTIIVLMTDKNYLINSWPFLVNRLRVVVDEIQAQANQIYEIDKSNRLLNSASGYGCAPLAPGQFRRRRYSSAGLRTLVELCGDEHLFSRLHARFSWIMKSCASRLFEQQVEGPAMIATSFDVHESPLCESWFDSQPKPSSSSSPLTSHHHHSFDLALNPAKDLSSINRPEISSLHHLMRIIGADLFRYIIHNVVIGNQFIVRGINHECVAPALFIIGELLPAGCCHLVPFDVKYHAEWECNFLGIADTVSIPSHVPKSTYVLVDAKLVDSKACSGDRHSEWCACDHDKDKKDHRNQIDCKPENNHPQNDPISAPYSPISPLQDLCKDLEEEAQYEHDLEAPIKASNDEVPSENNRFHLRVFPEENIQIPLDIPTSSYVEKIMALLTNPNCSPVLIRDILMSLKEEWVK
eukprot:Sdes_comp20180_c0_seq1m13432